MDIFENEEKYNILFNKVVLDIYYMLFKINI